MRLRVEASRIDTFCIRKRGHHRVRCVLLMKTLTMIDVVPVASVVYYYDHVKNGDSRPAATHPPTAGAPANAHTTTTRYTSRARSNIVYALRVVIRHYLLLIISLRRDAGEKSRRVKKG